MTTKQRERMTWAAGRKASAPPAIPGYDVEDQDHPAHQPDPDMHKYENGDTSSWAEDVRQPPYPQGNPPATPGYDAEDQDHPAHMSPPRVSLTAAVRKRASKCLKLATIQLQGKKMTKAQIEDHAMDLMDLGDFQIDNMLNRFAGGFLADELLEEEVMEPIADDLDELLADEDEDDMAFVDPIMASAEKSATDQILARLDAMSAEITALKNGGVVASDDDDEDDEDGDTDVEASSQNDPKGPTLSPTPKTEDAARKPEVQAAVDPIIQEFDSYDTGKTGFVGVNEWKGSKAVFAALDTDKDGYLARVDLVTACGCDSPGLEPEEMAMLAEMTAAEEVTACDGQGPAADLLEDEWVDDPLEDVDLIEEPVIEEPMIVAEDDAAMFGMTHDPMGLSDGSPVMSSEDDALLAEIFGGKVAKKSDEDEDADDDADVEGKKKAAKKSDDDEDADDAEVEGKKKAAKKSEEEEEVVEEEVEGKKKAAKTAKTASQRPQPRKPSTGVKQIGNLTKTAKNSEVEELQSLWATMPDVSGVFGK